MRLLILFGMLSAAIAAVPSRQQRIVGGWEVEIEEHPYTAQLERELYWPNSWSLSCAGTLITSTTVLTAAQCFENAGASPWRVRLGTKHRTSGGSVHDVSRIKVHEGFTGTTGSTSFEHDLAIVYMDTPAVFSRSVRAARIAGNRYRPLTNSQVVSAGWGYLSSSHDYMLLRLQKVETRVIDQAFCAERYAELKSSWGFADYPDVMDNMICSGILRLGGKGSCFGDAGGPLIHQYDVLVGIISWSYPCAVANYPDVSTRVSYYTDWIVENVSTDVVPVSVN